MDLKTVCFNHFLTKQIAQMQAPLTYIPNMPSLNPSWDTEYHVYAVMVPRSTAFISFCCVLCYGSWS
jgi:hypothetical protein